MAMVVLNKIYTRTGDKGETALGNGEAGRQAFGAGVNAYGTSDELNSFVGVARLEAEGEMDAGAGAHSERPVRSRCRSVPTRRWQKDAEAEYPPLRMVAVAQVERLESRDRRS